MDTEQWNIKENTYIIYTCYKVTLFYKDVYVERLNLLGNMITIGLQRGSSLLFTLEMGFGMSQDRKFVKRRIVKKLP